MVDVTAADAQEQIEKAQAFLSSEERLVAPAARDYVAEAHVRATLALAYATLELSNKYRRR